MSIMQSSKRSVALAAAALSFAAVGCGGRRPPPDPIVRITTESGTELGVSTDYGVVFLGRTAQRGAVTVEAVFGDGPSSERSVAEPVGGGLFTARTDIELPAARISFAPLRAGDALVVAGRTDEGGWESSTRVVEDPRVFGLIVEPLGGPLGRADQVGAGVFRATEGGARELVGLVSGRITLDGRTYLAVVGPDETWRLVAHRRDLLRRKPWVYREDIM